jgi:hypothetical protein
MECTGDHTVMLIKDGERVLLVKDGKRVDVSTVKVNAEDLPTCAGRERGDARKAKSCKKSDFQSALNMIKGKINHAKKIRLYNCGNGTVSSCQLGCRAEIEDPERLEMECTGDHTVMLIKDGERVLLVKDGKRVDVSTVKVNAEDLPTCAGRERGDARKAKSCKKSDFQSALNMIKGKINHAKKIRLYNCGNGTVSSCQLGCRAEIVLQQPERPLSPVHIDSLQKMLLLLQTYLQQVLQEQQQMLQQQPSLVVKIQQQQLYYLQLQQKLLVQLQHPRLRR